jgi:hypothetical protein
MRSDLGYVAMELDKDCLSLRIRYQVGQTLRQNVFRNKLLIR